MTITPTALTVQKPPVEVGFDALVRPLEKTSRLFRDVGEDQERCESQDAA